MYPCLNPVDMLNHFLLIYDAKKHYERKQYKIYDNDNDNVFILHNHT